MGRILAAADIGSNTAHLLVAEATRTGLKRLANDSEWLNLGEIVSRTGVVPPEDQLRLVQTLRDFRLKAESFKAERVFVFATEAMRKAANCRELLERIQVETELGVQLISPKEEAELGLTGALMDCQPEMPSILVEAGGGSVQASWVQGRHILKEVSLPIGTGALIARSGLDQPGRSESLDLLQSIIRQNLEYLNDFELPRSMMACGGVARGIWRAMHPDGDPVLLKDEVRYLIWDCQRLRLDQIAARYGVKPKRAATLVPGGMVYLALMERFEVESMRVSQFGVREGAILQMAAGLR